MHILLQIRQLDQDHMCISLQRTPQTKPYWEMYRQPPWGSPHLTHDLVVCFLKIKFIEGSSVSQIWLTENRLHAGT